MAMIYVVSVIGTKIMPDGTVKTAHIMGAEMGSAESEAKMKMLGLFHEQADKAGDDSFDRVEATVLALDLEVSLTLKSGIGGDNDDEIRS